MHKLVWLIVGAVLVDNFAIAADHYIRAGATGGNDGSDWTNAWTALPSALVRGDTYYVADGNYSGYTFDDKESGEAYITIRKATIAKHGDNIGWDNSYGDGQATFGTITFKNDYYIFDGQVGGGPGSWTSGHGFKIKGTGGDQKLIRLDVLAETPDYIQILHVDLQHRGIDTETGDDGIYQNSTGDGSHYIILAYCYLHDFGRAPILTRRSSHWTVEYCLVARNSYSATQHSEAWSDQNSDNMILRYNMWADIEGTAYLAFLGDPPSTVENWEIYGNVFYYSEGNPYNRSGVGNGVIATRTGNEARNCKIYNNTFVNIPGIDAGVDFSTGSGNLVYNNLWYSCPADRIIINTGNTARDFNWFFGNTDDGRQSEPNIQIGSGDPFVDWVKGDFRLRQSTKSGKNLEAPYQNDPLQNRRGADGIWDRGAFEFEQGGSVLPDPPRNLRLRVVP